MEVKQFVDAVNETDDEVAWQTLRSFCATWFK